MNRRELLKAVLLAPLAFLARRLKLGQPNLHGEMWIDEHLVATWEGWDGMPGPMRFGSDKPLTGFTFDVDSSRDERTTISARSKPLYYDEEGNPAYSTGWITISRG